jgi:formate hydrogenlyase subunit 3/multisubunit Na+/H+ antiporter MnhD subunit
MSVGKARITAKRKIISAILLGLAVLAFIYFLSHEPSVPLERKGTGGGILGDLDINSVIALLTALVSLAASVVTFFTRVTARRKS